MISAKVLQLFPRDHQLAIRARANETLNEAEWYELHGATTICQRHEIMLQRAAKAAECREQIGLYRLHMMARANAARRNYARSLKQTSIRRK